MVRRDRNHPSIIIWSAGNEEWSLQSSEASGPPGGHCAWRGDAMKRGWAHMRPVKLFTGWRRGTAGFLLELRMSTPAMQPSRFERKLRMIRLRLSRWPCETCWKLEGCIAGVDILN